MDYRIGEVEKRFRVIPDTTTFDEIIHYMGDVWVLPWVLGVNNSSSAIPQNKRELLLEQKLCNGISNHTRLSGADAEWF